MEKTHREQTIELNDEQIRLLERFSPSFANARLRFTTPENWWRSTPSSSARSGVGKVYLQTVLDCYSRHAWGRLYTSKLPVTSVHVLNETVLPFSRPTRHGSIPSLSDNGREFCGRADHHPYELFLQLEGIEHRTTKVRRPQSNGFIERLHRTAG